MIENDLKDKVENIYEKFDKKPIASASLAQVHKALLKVKNIILIYFWE